MAPVLGYWSIRALAEPIRTLLAYTDTQYENKTYLIGPPPDYDRSCWFNEKHSLGLDVPNLPYYIDGDLKISESSAILRHLGRKYNLYGDTEEEKIRIDVAQSVMHDQFQTLVKLIFNPEYETAKVAYAADIDNQLQKCAVLLKGDFVAGGKISFADFMLLEHLDRFEAFTPGCLDKFPTLKAFEQRMTALPKIKAYRESPFFQTIKTRFTGRMCPFGAGRESY